MTGLARAAALLGIALITSPPVFAQPVPAPVTSPPESGFLAAYRYHLGIEALSGADPRYQWAADIGGDIDVVDYGRGRANVLFDYALLLGNIQQPFDPIYNDYTIELSSSARLPPIELALQFQHVSRHLGDRRKPFGIAWNELGIELRTERARGPLAMAGRARAMRVVMRDAVDYDAEFRGDVAVRYTLSRVVALTGTGAVRRVTVDDRLVGRGGQLGGRVEAGVRFAGRKGAVELYAAAERRVDPDPFELRPASWFAGGLRVRN